LRYLLLLAVGGSLYAQTGVVKSANQPIPGATVTATIGTQKVETTTSDNGTYTLPAAPAGECAIEVRMFGFEPVTKKVSCVEGQKIDFTLQMQESPMAERLARMNGAQGGGNELATQL
jgi:Carboxypeptidase regulatory-like domain